jgi:RimJ/RimL family protein N-acetyltransferase
MPFYNVAETLLSATSACVRVGEAPLTLRHIRPDDEPQLRAAFAGLSRASRYARFRGLSTLTDAQWRYLTNVDGHDHVALIAVTVVGEIVGVARFVRQGSGARDAELAITVADRFQRKGLGHTLLLSLLPLARARGIDSLVAYTAADNQGIARLLMSHGGRCVSMEQGESELRLPLHAQENDAA